MTSRTVANANHHVSDCCPGDEQEEQHEPVAWARVSRRKMIGQHDKEQWERDEAVMHRPLFGTLTECEIGRPAGARCVEHLLLGGKNSLPHIRDHDRAEQCPDVDEGGAAGKQPAHHKAEGGQERERDGGCERRTPGQRRTPVEHGRHFSRAWPALLHLVEPTAVDHPQVALDPGLLVCGFGQRAVQPDEVERAANPGDARDEVRPPQQQVRPIAEPTGHGGSNFTVKPCPARPRQARRTASLSTPGAAS